MTSDDMNILRAVAKQVIKESAEETKPYKAKGYLAKRNAINAAILKRHHAKIQGRFSLVELIYAVGVVKGILREPD